MLKAWKSSGWIVATVLLAAFGHSDVKAQNIFTETVTEVVEIYVGSNERVLAIIPYPQRCQVRVYVGLPSDGDPTFHHFYFENLKSKNIKKQASNSSGRIAVIDVPIFQSVGLESTCKEVARVSGSKCRSAFGEYGFWTNELVLVTQKPEQLSRLVQSLAQIEDFCREMLFDGEQN